MKFNASKCQTMQIYRSTKSLEIDKAIYLGFMITDTLDWGPHINSIVTKANRYIHFIKRNISNCPQ